MLKQITVRALTASCLVSIFNLFLIGLPELALADNSRSRDRAGLPFKRVGGGTRGESCNFERSSLKALMPQNALGVTTENYPTFLFYLPQGSESQTVEFVLRGPNDELVYEKSFTNPGNSAVVSLSLPASELEPIQLEQDYRWYFSVICNQNDRAKDLVVEGLIRRVELKTSLANRLNQLQPLEQVEVYQNSDLPYEALTTLARIKSSQVGSIATNAKWTELLESVGLEAIADAPVIEAYAMPTEETNVVR